MILGVAAALIVAVLAVYPQWNLRALRGADFSGAFASCDLDEMAYAAYLQALIDGRARRSDPYTGRDETTNEPQPESLFSIQFLPAYLIAVPARAFGMSAAEAMPIVSFVSAFLATLALFWFVGSMIEDSFAAVAATLCVMFGGALVVGIGAVNEFYEGGIAYPFAPFLRRYIPSLAFPFLFAFFGCLWNGLRAQSKTARAVYSIAASVCFAALVFSYFYVWTAAGAVLFGLTLFVLLFRSESWRADFVFLFITGAGCLIALVPYALLLARRDETMDKAQLLVFTREPDLLRTIEVVGYVVLTLTALALWRRFTALADRRAYFIAAFAFAPVLVFNQQILTNHSLQPFHYEFYVVNYVVLLALVLIVAVLWQRFIARWKTVSAALLSIIALVAVGWGYFEARETTAFWDSINIARDEAMPVNRRLRVLAGEDIETARRQTTLNLDAIQADSQPTAAPQAVLWARHQHVFAGLKDWDENKERYYQLLYYSNLDAAWLRSSLVGCRDIEACMALFGWDRFNARLSANARPLTAPEIEDEIARYDAYYKNFSRAQASRPIVSFVVVPNSQTLDLSNVERWYELGAGETFGAYTLYRARLKD